MRAYKSARAGRFDDRHHEHMARHYKETPWWWYVIVLVGSFFLGLVVVLKEDIGLPAWAYILSLVSGIIVAPFVSFQPVDLQFTGSRLTEIFVLEYNSVFSLR